MKIESRHLIHFFTGYSFVQLLGFLGDAYKATLLQPMLIIVGFLIVISVIFGVLNWIKAQNKVEQRLSGARILTCFAGSIVLIVLILFAVAVGNYIAL